MLERERFDFWRALGPSGGAVSGEYRGLALEDPVLAQVLAGNAQRWLQGCAVPDD